MRGKNGRTKNKKANRAQATHTHTYQQVNQATKAFLPFFFLQIFSCVGFPVA
jgi:hypothetical protein